MFSRKKNLGDKLMETGYQLIPWLHTFTKRNWVCMGMEREVVSLNQKSMSDHIGKEKGEKGQTSSGARSRSGTGGKKLPSL